MDEKKERKKVDLTRDGSIADNQFEVLNKLITVHGGDLSKNVTSDYTLAHLNLDDQVYIKETYENAGFLHFLIEKIAESGFEYEWDSEKRTWKRDSDGQFRKCKLSDTKVKLILAHAKYIFDSLMISPDVLVILKRNTDANHLLNVLGDVKLVDNNGEEMRDMDKTKDVIAKLKDKLRGESEK